MKKLFGFLFSSHLMAVLIAVFAISIAVATFIENDFGSQTARALIYNSKWFEWMLLLGIVNLTGTILTRKLYSKPKTSMFLFHLAFLLILMGAAITRYFGYEGLMHIREGESSNLMVSDNTYLMATATDNNQTAYAQKKVYISAISSNYQKLKLNLNNKHIVVECLKTIPNAQETLMDDPNGPPVLALVFAGNEERKNVFLFAHQPRKIGGILFTLDDTKNTSGMSVYFTKSGAQFKSAYKVTASNMSTQHTDTIQANTISPLQTLTLYNIEGVQFVVTSETLHGKVGITENKNAQKDKLPDALYIRVSSEGQSTAFYYLASRNALNNPTEVTLNHQKISVAFGANEIKLPFSIQLKKFILERYPGSNSPSWFESRVVLTDNQRGVNEEHRIFMNNVLKYRGYRFYESSYDTDEHGTVLMVNYDFWGTMITYAGYLLLAIGMILSLLNKNSHFRKLSDELSRLRALRKAGVLLLFFLLSFLSGVNEIEAQSSLPESMIIERQQAEKFGRLLIQDPKGRIKPINTLSSELIRKISRENTILEQTSDQVLLGMLIYPEFWQKVPMIRISDPDIRKILHITDSYASFNNFIDSTVNQSYVLSAYVTDAFNKKPVSRSKFDNEIIRLDERVNLCYLVYSGQFLRIFPKPGDENKTWYTPTNAKFQSRDSVFVKNIISIYFQTVINASRTKNWSLSDEALQSLTLFQNKYGKELIPSQFKTKLEILYNKMNIFERLGSFYGLIGFILLLLQFLSIFLPKLKLKRIITLFTILIIAGFVFHLAGLAARWYISGHAPWSNAYESLIYIAFATVLAGVVFSRKSGITLSATSLVAWLILFVAHLNWMDPEITNLVPVLKSYWLLIHVATITASYGFMALGAILAFINLIVMIFRTQKSNQNTGNIITELTIIIEMTLTIGLYMLTIGTFLGGVWANESWGRYWGWDSKETWALVSVLVYAFIVHMRMVPGLKGNYVFNLMALVGFSSIIMTYFGVNYYLSGLHSYAKGDSFPIPVFIYYTLAVVLFVAIIAWVNQKRFTETPTNHK
jgi:cytochrome c-type biogenesis protein CcsB